MNQKNDANLESILHSKVEIQEEFWYENCGLPVLARQNVSQLPPLQSNTPTALSMLSPRLSCCSDKNRNGVLSSHHKKPRLSPASFRSPTLSTVQEPTPFLFVSSNQPDAACTPRLRSLPLVASLEATSPCPQKPNPKSAQKYREPNKLRHCLFCDFKTSQRTTLYSHTVRRHGSCVFECNHCEKRFSTNSRLREHLKWHQLPEENETYFCLNCNFTARYSNTLRNHVLSKHSGLKFECDYCKKMFPRKSYLKQHMEKHVKDPQTCCGKWFKNNAMLDKHIWRRHTAKTLLCNFPGCKKSYMRWRALEKHKAKHTAKNLPPEQNVSSFFRCKDCTVGFKNESLLIEHISSTHTRQSDPKLDINTVDAQNARVFACPYCDHTVSTRSGVTFHVARKHRTYKFECDYCKKLFAVKRDLWRHVTCTHCVAPINCELCGKQYKHSDSLRVHHAAKHIGIPFQARSQSSRENTLNQNRKSKSTTSKKNVKPLNSTSNSLRRKQGILIDSAKMNPFVLLTRITLPLNKNKQLEHLNTKNSPPSCADDLGFYSAFAEKEIEQKNPVKISAALSDLDAILGTVVTSLTVKQEDVEVSTTSCEVNQKDTEVPATSFEVKQESLETIPISPVMAQANDTVIVNHEHVYSSNVIIKEEFWVEDTPEPTENHLEEQRKEHSQADSTHHEKRLLHPISSQKNTHSKNRLSTCQRNQQLKRSSRPSPRVNFVTGFWCRRRYWINTLKKNTLSILNTHSNSALRSHTAEALKSSAETVCNKS